MLRTLSIPSVFAAASTNVRPIVHSAVEPAVWGLQSNYRRDPEAVTKVFRSIVTVASTAIALADLMLYVDDLGLDPVTAARPSASQDDVSG
jgi:hypothetical protein